MKIEAQENGTKRGDLRLTLPPSTMKALRAKAKLERRQIQEQARLYIERGLEAERAA